MTPQQTAKGKSRNVVDLDRKQQKKQVSVMMRRIGKKPQMSEHPPEINEADDRQSNSLELVLRSIANNGNEQNQGDYIHRQRHEQPVPTRSWIVPTWVANKRGDTNCRDARINRPS